MCSLTLSSGIDAIGLSLQPDRDFSHIITKVDPNSPADRAGIEQDDCIMSLNDTPLLNISYEDVLDILKKSRNEPNLDFLVAKKSYLLKSYRNNSTLTSVQQDISGKYVDATSSTAAQVMPSSNIIGRNIPSTISPAQALEELYNKYSNEQQPSYDDPTNSTRPRETVSTTTNERYDRLSPQLDDSRYPSKQQQGQILQGVGPATADRLSWDISNGKSTDLPAQTSVGSSVHSNARVRPSGKFISHQYSLWYVTSISSMLYDIYVTFRNFQRSHL